MADSVADPVRVSQYKSPNRIFKCISWQYDRILDRYPKVMPIPYFGFSRIGDLSGRPPDIIIVQFRYRNEGQHVLPFNFWIKKQAVLHNNSPMYSINRDLSIIFKQMNIEEDSWVKSDMMHEVIDVARTLASMPQNADRDGLAFVYEINAYPTSVGIAIDSLDRVKFVGDTSHSETQICAVCLKEISHGDEVIWMPACSHVFHGNCIVSCLERKQTCPTCHMALCPVKD